MLECYSMELHKDYCGRCKVKGVPLINYSKRKTKAGITHFFYYCRKCTKEKYQNWYHKNPEKARQLIYKNNEKHAEKIAARTLLRMAVKRGDLIKPLRCSICENKTKLEAHHHDYTKPLDVQWLCTGCHGSVHK